MASLNSHDTSCYSCIGGALQLNHNVSHTSQSGANASRNAIIADLKVLDGSLVCSDTYILKDECCQIKVCRICTSVGVQG